MQINSIKIYYKYVNIFCVTFKGTWTTIKYMITLLKNTCMHEWISVLLAELIFKRIA